MRRTKEQAALTREAILDAALQVFLHKGFAASTLEDIAKAAKVTRGALYWHFEGKLDIYEQLYRRESKPNEAIQRIFTEDLPPFDCVRKVMLAIIDRFYTDESFRQYIELTTLKIESGVGAEELNRYKSTVYHSTILSISSKLEQAKAEKTISPKINALFTARHLLTFVIGIYRLYFTAPEHFQSLEESKAMLEEYLDLMDVESEKREVETET